MRAKRLSLSLPDRAVFVAVLSQSGAIAEGEQFGTGAEGATLRPFFHPLWYIKRLYRRAGGICQSVC